jgi:hypothetical protein
MCIVERVRCSPNTATRDLKALMDEGYTRRVQTSGHLRTCYFERTAPASEAAGP